MSKKEAIDWESMDGDALTCSILNGPDCESCGG